MLDVQRRSLLSAKPQLWRRGVEKRECMCVRCVKVKDDMSWVIVYEFVWEGVVKLAGQGELDIGCDWLEMKAS